MTIVIVRILGSNNGRYNIMKTTIIIIIVSADNLQNVMNKYRMYRCDQLLRWCMRFFWSFRRNIIVKVQYDTEIKFLWTNIYFAMVLKAKRAKLNLYIMSAMQENHTHQTQTD